MFHGRKKVDKVQLTEKELEEIDTKLQKIAKNNLILLTKRQNKEYTWETLTQTEKFSFLSPDFSTLWNYRREILVHLFTVELDGKPEEKLKQVESELKFLVKGIMKSPKSYTLWFQRQWIIEKGLGFERDLKLDQSKIMEMELMLCNKMLKMDERNFHCWNYRLWVVEIYLKENTKRALQAIQTDDCKEVFEKLQKPLIEKECQMALEMIHKSFSNYSAWHYRAKLMPKLENLNDNIYTSGYVIPLEQIQKDLAMLKHAFFTDPKDQSPWNYHEWLIQQIQPVYVKDIRLGDNQIGFELSTRVRNFQQLEIKLTQNANEIKFDVEEQGRTRGLNEKWVIKITSEEFAKDEDFELSVKQKMDVDEQSYKQGNFFRADSSVILFKNLDLSLNLKTQTFSLKELDETTAKLQQNLIGTLISEIEGQGSIKELSEFEGGLRLALHRLMEIKGILYCHTCNPFYKTEKIEQDDHTLEFYAQQLIDLEISEINAKLYYQKVLTDFKQLQTSWDDITASNKLQKL